jgi:hypothetical protein
MKLPMPESSWEALKKIVRAYRAADSQDNPTVEGIAKLAGMHRPVVSINNGFLRAVGIVQPDKYRLTEAGGRLAGGIALDNQSIVARAIQGIVQGNEVLNTLYSMISARGQMTVADFKAEFMLLTELNEDSRQVPFIKTLLDMFVEGKVVQVNDNVISLLQDPDIRAYSGEPKAPSTTERVAQQESRGAASISQQQADGVPFALGPNRIAYVILPAGWNASKDLKKLLKLIELGLDEGAVTE